MKTPRTLQTKRTRPKSGFRMLHAATKKRKQRASTTATPEDLGEVPGVGVPLALVVILLLHIAAIAGIWIHDKWSESADLKATKPALKENVQPARIEALDFHLVSKGETLETISTRYGVSADALAKVNGGTKTFEAGWKINLPPQRIPNPTSTASVAGVNSPAAGGTGIVPQERPLIHGYNNESLEGSTPGALVEVGGNQIPDTATNNPVLIRPVTPGPRELQPITPPPALNQANRHVVQSGETLWRIARNNGISVDDLKRANPNVNVSALKIGTALVIPASR